MSEIPRSLEHVPQGPPPEMPARPEATEPQDDKYFERLVEAAYPLANAFLHKRFPYIQQADREQFISDVLQDASLKAWLHRFDFREEKAQFNGWFNQIALNEAYGRLRKPTYEVPLEDSGEDSQSEKQKMPLVQTLLKTRMHRGRIMLAQAISRHKARKAKGAAA